MSRFTPPRTALLHVWQAESWTRSLMIAVGSRSTNIIFPFSANTVTCLFACIHVKLTCSHRHISHECSEMTVELHGGYYEDTLHPLTGAFLTITSKLPIAVEDSIGSYINTSFSLFVSEIHNGFQLEHTDTDINCSQIPFSGCINTQSGILSACVQTHLWQYWVTRI